ncbi:TetR/AcrR family transcriptional regulator [Alloalcanivorax xenomutans]|uniref:TetR/AcrR family transcriptional regulator n=1 Tax=Alloalcanivorax xenomutans TaxID=1094342 RepID=UPI0006D7C950|nr:TetR/AcrR family transcriptional regulator [Alloalcanivorax xenomutans]
MRTQKSPSRRPKHDPSVSENEILRAAELLLRECPFREVTVDAVMRRTGLKRPAFYVHFRDRYDVVLRLVQGIGREMLEMSRTWLEGDDPLNDARQALEGLVSIYLRHGPLLRAITDAAATDERVESMYRGLIQDFIKATAEHIRDEQAKGRVRSQLDVEETARALVWLDERYLSEALGRTPQADPAVVARVLLNIWISTLYGSSASSI